MSDVATQKWGVDRRIPAWGVILLLVAMLGQAAAAVAWGATASQRLSAVEQRQAELKNVPEQLGRIDERTEQMQKTLDRLAGRP